MLPTPHTLRRAVALAGLWLAVAPAAASADSLVFLKGDDIWLSPMYGRDCAVLSVHQYRDMPREDYFQKAEALLRRPAGRRSVSTCPCW